MAQAGSVICWARREALDHLRADVMSYFTQVVARVIMVGIGFGLGWILSEVFAFLGASPTRQWWAFYVPIVIVGAGAVSGFVTDVLPLPRPLVYLALLAAGFYGLAQEPESRSPTEPTTVTGDTAAGFHFTASLGSRACRSGFTGRGHVRTGS
jgi:hypothetical protein